MTDEREQHHDRPHPWPTDQLTRGAAAFLAEVVGLDGDPDALDGLAADLGAIKRDSNAAIFTIQLDSSIGPAAFLVYAYLLDERGGDGRTGRELYEAGLATLEEAAQRQTPGPRAVAHAETGMAGFILATTPGTYRALQGDSAPADSTDVSEDRPTTSPSMSELDHQRADTVSTLLRLLRDANVAATEWLTAIQAASSVSDAGAGDLVAFNEEETALALFLLDEQSIGDLLKMLNLIVAAAQQQAASAVGRDAPRQ